VDALFAAAFRLPRAPEREVYYCSVVTEVTKLAPGEVAPTLGRAIRWLFERVGEMRGVVGMRFGVWFALHLSNFGFTYKWEEWYDTFPP
jgi:nuclear cap-binding protein subunit 1